MRLGLGLAQVPPCRKFMLSNNVIKNAEQFIVAPTGVAKHL
jgi:hypothetical protein